MAEGQLYQVRQGDSVESIAVENGHFWQTLWDHAENAPLRQRRQDPHILYPGDEVFVPALHPKEEACATDKRHTFVRRGVPSRLRVVILEDGQPHADERYVLVIDGHSYEGTTGADGSVEQPIPPQAKSGKLILSPGQRERIYTLQLGGLDPLTEISGLQGRLRNLGYLTGPITGEVGPETTAAIERFQRRNGLTVTGEPDAATRERLQQRYGT
jgi:hypothetical protein